MKQQILTGLAAALTATAVGLASSSQANQDQGMGAKSEPKASFEAYPISNPQFQTSQNSNAIKVGEHQSQGTDATVDETIAKIYTHEISGRTAVTLHVRGIPIVTFLSSQVTPAKGVKVATAGNTDRLLSSSSSAGASTNNLQDPVWRATAVAAKLNQLDRERFDAKAVKVIWDVRRKSYVISANNEHLLEMSPQTILPHTTHDPAKDALQITNRLRQQLGNAPPLTQIPGQPVAKKTRTPQILAFGPIRFQIKGWASWYGPGFQGNPTASGERFNQYALTAAHRTLPFGTRMRVTNLYNGRSVVVRVNDRGPYSGGRVLDLSRGAAQVLGVVNSGTAPVKIDVLH